MERQLKIIKENILSVFTHRNKKVKNILLFGSRARGDFEKKSDFDLLIIVEEPISLIEKREMAREIRKKLAEKLIPCDVIIKSISEVEYYREFIGSVVREALKEGIPI